MIVRLVLWSLAATVSLLLVAVFGVPEIANRLTPIVPYSAEIKLGAAVDAQVRGILDKSNSGARFVCGSGSDVLAGRGTARVVPCAVWRIQTPSPWTPPLEASGCVA